MTLFKPTLILTRLRVEKGLSGVYDEKFHEGVNIIRGENSSGKSTIMNFIYYALGGDLNRWSEEALQCDHVFAEVEINGHLATLRREISDQFGRPMDIVGGSLDEALKKPSSSWSRYPYVRSAKESFSQVLFRLLDIPEAAGENSGNLTMHQILRLTYADQLSPAESLFRSDGRWDTPTIRDAVGRLLCGAQETKIYENQLRIRDLRKEFDRLDTQFGSFLQAYGADGQSLTIEWVTLQRTTAENEIARISQRIGEVERLQLTSLDDELTLGERDLVFAELQLALAELNDAQEIQSVQSVSIVDLQRYLENQRAKLVAVKDAKLVSDSIGEIRFDVCPVCFEPVIEEFDHACHLCKAPVDLDRRRDQFVQFVNDIALQISQAETVLASKRAKLEQATAAVHAARLKWSEASRRFEQVKLRPTTGTQAELRTLYREKGYLERQIEDLDRRFAIIERVAAISKDKLRVSSEIKTLEDEILILKVAQEERLSKGYSSISNNVRQLLMRDLPRQDSFIEPRSVDFDFGANRISVDGHVYFSASSRVILKTSFFISFLLAALENEFFRHPRFCLIDTIEDKGMEAIRSKHFQKQIVEVSESKTVKHQIIFATSMIDESLDNERYTVGKFSTRERHTLEFSAKLS